MLVAATATVRRGRELTRRALNSQKTRLAAEHALVDASAEELEKAHAIIAIMLNCLSADAKRDMAVHVTAAGLDGERDTRANERERLLSRLAVARAGRSTMPVPYAHSKLIEAAMLARRELKPLLAADLSTMASALADALDAASAFVSSIRERTPECVQLQMTLARFGVFDAAVCEDAT